ncbi:MAG: neutral/alkaline non-lysosomal ceramidase N-terminal domain-containing protein [Myxococcota bacterium]
MSTRTRSRGSLALPRTALPVAVAVLLVALLGEGAAASERQPGPAPLRAGFGIAPLPAPLGAGLAGYGGMRTRRARGILDSPEARALVLAQGGRRLALVSMDILIARPRIRAAALDAAAPLALDHLWLFASHTHSGPGGFEPGWIAERVMGASFDPEAARRLGGAAARAIEAAVSDLSPARLAAIQGTIGLAENRRFADGPVETKLAILRIEPTGGKPPVVLFSFGAHPTVLSPRSRDYSGDFVAAARRDLERAGLRPIFVQGPLGDQQPVSREGPLWPKALAAQRRQVHEIGRRLATAVLETLARAPQARAAGLRAAERWARPPQQRLRRFCPFWWLAPVAGRFVDRFLSERVPFVALGLGDALLVGVPAEPSSRVGDALRELLARAPVRFAVAHANDWLGYVVEPDTYRQGGYESCMSFFGPDLSSWLVSEARRTVEALE